MTVYRGSRYEYASSAYVKDKYSDNLYTLLFYTFDTLGTLTYSEYVWNSGDRLDVLANDMYGSSGSWWMIMEHNPEVADPFNIEPGTVLRIPRVS